MDAMKRTVMTKRLVTLVVAAVLLAAGGLCYYRTHNTVDAPAPMTAAVTRGDVVAKVEATGTLAPVTTVQVGSQVSGTIKALHADYNSEVKKGQVVAELDASLFQTQVEQARSTLVKVQADGERAQVELVDANAKARRAQELYDQKLISRNDLETAQATAAQAQAAIRSAQAMVTQARAALNQNQVNLGHTIITAPIDGIVISRSVDVGQTVAASMQAPTLFVIAQDLGHMQVSASIDESDIGRIAAGQPVSFRVDAYPAETFRGTVSQVRLEAKNEQNVVSYTTMIDVPNEDLKLKPGMTANVTVQTAMNEDVLRVPNAALRFRPQVTEPGSATSPSDTRNPGSAGSQVRGTSGQASSADLSPRSFGAVPRSSAAGGGDRNFGRVFVLREGQFVPVRVHTGVTDGTMTAVVDGDLKEGDQVVTGLSQPGLANPQTNTSSPLIPFGRRGAGANRGTAAGAAGARGGAAR
jgi:HlyD family secretion protein